MDIFKFQDFRKRVRGEVKRYILSLITATRKHSNIELGCSSRVSLSLMKGSLVVIRGRDYVTPEDVKEMTVLILSHRIVLKGGISTAENQAQEMIVNILNAVEIPLAKM